MQEYSYRRSNGGHLLHITPKDGYNALCGYRPTSPKGHMIRDRGRWVDRMSTTVTLKGSGRVCKKCLKEYERAKEKADATKPN